MIDLFPSTLKTKKEQLLDFIRAKKWVRTSDVIRWGLDNFHTRADRDARELASQGLIRRMPEELKNFRFNHTKEDVWEFVGNNQ